MTVIGLHMQQTYLSLACLFTVFKEMAVISMKISTLKRGLKRINFMSIQYASKCGNFSATDVTRVA